MPRLDLQVLSWVCGVLGVGVLFCCCQGCAKVVVESKEEH